MTEKRFIDDGFEAIEDQSFTDILTKKTYYVEYFDEVVDLCNSLWEQTKRFEKHNKDLMEENEQLKSIIDKLIFDNTKMKKVSNSTKKENEQLKHEIEDFQELLALKEQKEFLKPIIQQIEEARERERTNLEKSVLQQLLEQLQ